MIGPRPFSIPLPRDVAIAALPMCSGLAWKARPRPHRSSFAVTSGVALVLDLTQSLGALPFSVRDLQNDVQPDFAVGQLQMAAGPYSVGLSMSLLMAGGIPLEENWIQRANARGFLKPDPVHGDYDAARGVSIWASAQLRVCCRRARHEAIAGVENRADL